MTNFEKLKADIQNAAVSEFLTITKKIAYFDCGFCEYQGTCKNLEIPCSIGVRHWLESEVDE